MQSFVARGDLFEYSHDKHLILFSYRSQKRDIVKIADRFIGRNLTITEHKLKQI